MDLWRHYEQMIVIRFYYEYLWDDLTEYVLPSQGTYVYRDPRTDPERRSKRRFDSTAVIAARQLMARVVAEMTGSGARWFDYRDPDPQIDADPEVRAALQALSDRAYTVLNNGIWRTAHTEATMEWIVYGTGCMHMEEDEETNTLLFKSIPLNELWASENDHNDLDYIYRKFKLTYRQLCEFTKDEYIPDYLHEIGEREPLKEIYLLHCMKPNDEYDEHKKNAKNYKYKSVYMLFDSKIIIKEGYFKRKPYVAFRFWKRPDEAYGGSPAVDALADIRMLNTIEECNIRSIQLEAFPPLVMAHDSVVLPIRIHPNGINYGGMSPDGKRLIQPLFEKGGNRESLERYMEQKRQSIQSSFFVDPRMNQEASIRTAAEVQKRSGEEMIGISPFLHRYEIEYLYHVLGFVLDYVIKNNKDIQIPKKLDGRMPIVDFSAPLAKTQRAQELNNTTQWLQIMQSLAQADPTVLANIDMNSTAHILADLLGVPSKAMKTPEQMAAAQAAQQKQMQQQQQGEQMANAGQGVSGAANAMSNLAKSGLINRGDFGLPGQGGDITGGV